MKSKISKTIAVIRDKELKDQLNRILSDTGNRITYLSDFTDILFFLSEKDIHSIVIDRRIFQKKERLLESLNRIISANLPGIPIIMLIESSDPLQDMMKGKDGTLQLVRIPLHPDMLRKLVMTAQRKQFRNSTKVDRMVRKDVR